MTTRKRARSFYYQSTAVLFSARRNPKARPGARLTSIFDNIADIRAIRHTIQMDISVAQVADDLIELQRYNADEAPEVVFDRGWVLYNLVYDNPELAWETIKEVVRRYDEHDLSDDKTEGHRILGMTAAGPFEDLLAYHGSIFVDRVETEAKRDPRMAWTLRGMWQNAMSDDVWSRVCGAAQQTPN